MNRDLAGAVVADIGATNARFARLGSDGKPGPMHKLSTWGCKGFVQALDVFIAQEGGPMPKDVALAVAGPILGERVSITNAPWSFDIPALEKELGLSRLAVLNDFEALALALPYLESGDLAPVDNVGAKKEASGNLAVLGPGTGLGGAGLVRQKGAWCVVSTEVGHTDLAPYDQKELAVWSVLKARHGRVSAERVLSGSGLMELHSALAQVDYARRPDLSPEEIVELGLSGKDDYCRRALLMFCAFLGSVAGDVCLMFRATGGVYLGGGIAPSLVDLFPRSEFRNRFCGKGRGKPVVGGVPVKVITSEAPALLGCAHALSQ